MSVPRQSSARILRQLDEAKYLTIRAGADHRFIWVWVVVVNGRVYIRSWNDYAGKYTTPAAQKYVRGFNTPRRRATTSELVPR